MEGTARIELRERAPTQVLNGMSFVGEQREKFHGELSQTFPRSDISRDQRSQPLLQARPPPTKPRTGNIVPSDEGRYSG